MVDFLILLIKNKDNVTFGFLYCFFFILPIFFKILRFIINDF